MSEFLGVIHPGITGGGFPAGLSPNVFPPPQWTAVEGHHYDRLETLDSAKAAPFVRGETTAARAQSFKGAHTAYPGDDFFEQVIVLPRRLDLGIILADREVDLEVYNSYRNESRELTAFASSAGSGISIPDLPSLPYELLSQTGLDLTLLVDAVGPATVNGTLDFTFDSTVILVPITAQRTLVLPFEPEIPLVERLLFKTDVLRALDGTEQRRSLRHAPRQEWELNLVLEGRARRLYESIVFDTFARTVGVPTWYEPAVVKAAISVSDTVVTVDSTAYADFREGSLAMIWRDEHYYETLEIDSLTATTITFSSAFTKTFSRGARIMPMRVGYVVSATGGKEPQNQQGARVVVRLTDGDLDRGDTAPFESYNSKVLFREAILADPTCREDWSRIFNDHDGGTGVFHLFTHEPNARRTHQRGVVTRSRQKLWEVRNLLHHLRGRQVSFYSPTDSDDVVVVEDVSQGTSTVDVENVGYTKFVKSRPHRNIIRVTLADGTVIIRAVESSSELDEDVERLVITGSWPQDFDVADIQRVDFLEKVRLASDEVSIRHKSGLGDAVISFPAMGVLE